MSTAEGSHQVLVPWRRSYLKRFQCQQQEVNSPGVTSRWSYLKKFQCQQQEAKSPGVSPLEVVLPEEVPVPTTGSKVTRCLSPGGGLTWRGSIVKQVVVTRCSGEEADGPERLVTRPNWTSQLWQWQWHSTRFISPPGAASQNARRWLKGTSKPRLSPPCHSRWNYHTAHPV